LIKETFPVLATVGCPTGTPTVPVLGATLQALTLPIGLTVPALGILLLLGGPMPALLPPLEVLTDVMRVPTQLIAAVNREIVQPLPSPLVMQTDNLATILHTIALARALLVLRIAGRPMGTPSVLVLGGALLITPHRVVVTADLRRTARDGAQRLTNVIKDGVNHGLNTDQQRLVNNEECQETVPHNMETMCLLGDGSWLPVPADLP